MCDMDYDIKGHPIFRLPSKVREEQKEQTRTRILTETLILISDHGEDAVTIKAVADRAEVTSRTVFRHFESRDVLLQAAWRWVGEQVRPKRRRASANALIKRPRTFFPQLHDLGGLLRRYLHRRERRAGGRLPDERKQELFLKCVREELAELDERTLRRRAAIAEVLTSANAFEVMQESWGFNGKEAGAAAAEALEILLNRRIAYWKCN